MCETVALVDTLHNREKRLNHHTKCFIHSIRLSSMSMDKAKGLPRAYLDATKTGIWPALYLSS